MQQIFGTQFEHASGWLSDQRVPTGKMFLCGNFFTTEKCRYGVFEYFTYIKSQKLKIKYAIIYARLDKKEYQMVFRVYFMASVF